MVGIILKGALVGKLVIGSAIEIVGVEEGVFVGDGVPLIDMVGVEEGFSVGDGVLMIVLAPVGDGVIAPASASFMGGTKSMGPLTSKAMRLTG